VLENQEATFYNQKVLRVCGNFRFLLLEHFVEQNAMYY